MEHTRGLESVDFGVIRAYSGNDALDFRKASNLKPFVGILDNDFGVI